MTQSSHPTFVSHPSDRGLEQPSGSSHRGIFDLEQQTINADSSTCLRNVMVENELELVLGQCAKDVELTLSVGQASNSNKGNEKRSSTNSSDGEGDSSDMNNPSSSQESSKKPRWLLRALSLNRT